jgi:GTP cyclohydrolase I
MTQQVADALESMLRPHGVAVYLEAHHLCTQIRGVREEGPATRTTAFRGVYAARPELRSEYFDIAGLRRGSR